MSSMDSRLYATKIREITEYASKNGIHVNKVNEIFEECFTVLNRKTLKKRLFFKLANVCGIISLITISSILIFYNNSRIHNIFLRNIQNFIYPGLRIFRKLSVPVITAHPSLSEWYDEWCILQNPYFQVNEMDCWPCSTVNSVQNLTGYNITSLFNSGIPFTQLEKPVKVDLNSLIKTYMKNPSIFIKDAEKITSNKRTYRKISDLVKKRLDIHPSSKKNVHITWRINRMEPNRQLRKLFPKLSRLPEWWSPSTEKFIFIDEPKTSSYSLPSPECANVIIHCTNGEKRIQLVPSPECTKNCKKLNTVLSAHQSLWYNWWYWRPISFPSNNTEDITITYLTSYC